MKIIYLVESDCLLEPFNYQVFSAHESYDGALKAAMIMPCAKDGGWVPAAPEDFIESESAWTNGLDSMKITKIELLP